MGDKQETRNAAYPEKTIGRNSNTFLHALRNDFEVGTLILHKSILMIFPSTGRMAYSERKLPSAVG